MNKKIVFLVIGLIVFFLGSYQNIRHEARGIRVIAQITNIETTDRTDDGPESYKHVYYGDYKIDGKEYKNVKIYTSYTGDRKPSKNVGQEMEVVVNPDNHGGIMLDGGIFVSVGFLVAVWSSVSLARDRKERTLAQKQQTKSEE